jgi:FkbM family methyltransferase
MQLLNKAKNKIENIKIRILSYKDIIMRSELGFRIILNLKKDVDVYFYKGNFESDTLNYFKSIIKTGDIIFDIGANIGIYTLIASLKTGSQGKVYSFEPADWAYDRLSKNIKLNEFSNIISIKKGVADYSRTADFFQCEDDAYNSIGKNPMRDVKHVNKIEITSIDDFICENNITKIDVLKIDTEGADYLVLKGAQKILQSDYPPVIFCEYNRNIKNGFDYTLEDFEQFIKSYNYNIFELHDGKLIPFDAAKSQSNEIICIKGNA